MYLSRTKRTTTKTRRKKLQSKCLTVPNAFTLLPRSNRLLVEDLRTVYANIIIMQISLFGYYMAANMPRVIACNPFFGFCKETATMYSVALQSPGCELNANQSDQSLRLSFDRKKKFKFFFPEISFFTKIVQTLPQLMQLGIGQHIRSAQQISCKFICFFILKNLSDNLFVERSIWLLDFVRGVFLFWPNFVFDTLDNSLIEIH